MTEEGEVLRIAINLENPIKAKFEQVQKALGIRNRTDVLRWLINWYYEKIIAKKEQL